MGALLMALEQIRMSVSVFDSIEMRMCRSR